MSRREEEDERLSRTARLLLTAQTQDRGIRNLVFWQTQKEQER